MSQFETFFQPGASVRDDHPLIQLLESQAAKPEFGSAKLRIDRQRAALGFEPARMNLLFLDKNDGIMGYQGEPWDPALNSALVQKNVTAIDEPNEVQRFGLALEAALDRPENQYGDGFYNAVLMQVIDATPFAATEQIRALRPYISVNRPYRGAASSIEYCSSLIQAAFQDRWQELRKALGYDQQQSERILAGGLAYYLDERFSITDGRKMGWLKPR